jgi:hypothetical protein
VEFDALTLDNNPTLSITEADDGKILLHCVAGCEIDDIRLLAGLRWENLMPDGPLPTLVVATYDYRDEDGMLLYQVLRFEPKAFEVHLVHGKWKSGFGQVRRVLYRLPEIYRSGRDAIVFMAGGERDCDALASIGVLATTNLFGARSWDPDYNESLQGRHVALLEDNDKAGRNRVAKRAKLLYKTAASIRLVKLPGLPAKGDVYDWLVANGWTPELAEASTPRFFSLKTKLRAELLALVEGTQCWDAEATMSEAKRARLPEREEDNGR